MKKAPKHRHVEKIVPNLSDKEKPDLKLEKLQRKLRINE